MTMQISTRTNSRRGAKNTQPDQWRIEGALYTTTEIGKRLGVSRRTAKTRMDRLLGADGPITFARLEAFGK